MNKISEKSKILLILFTFIIFIFTIIKGLGDALTPLVISFILSYLTFPIIKRFEKLGIKRKITIPSVFLIILVICTLLISYIVPILSEDIQTFFSEFPTSLKKVLKLLNETIPFNIEINKNLILNFVEDNVKSISTTLIKSFSKTLSFSFNQVTSIVIGLLNILLIPMFYYYLVNDFEVIENKINALIPKDLQPKLKYYFSKANKILSGYIRGQFLVASIVALIYAVGLQLIGLKFGILIGLLSGVLCIIPYIGFALGFFTAIFISISNYAGVMQLFLIVGLFAIAQTLEGFFITPKLVGDKVGLGPLLTIFSLIIFGNLFGFIGMIIAIPLGALAKIIISDILSVYFDTINK